jgi:transposase InsO family protein
MAWKVTAMDSRMIAAVADLDGRSVRSVCAELGISRQTFYKWRNRYRAEGLAGLEERSRRPVRSIYATTAAVDERIRVLRKRLIETGWDGGAASIRVELEHEQISPLPSEATIWRRLVAMGFVIPEPKKSPKKFWRRFEAERPNDRWQLDMTHWALTDGAHVEILNIIDDHSRLAVASVVAPTVTSTMVWDVFSQAAALLGLPTGALTDNGLIFSGKLRGFEVAFETALRHAGVHALTSSPFHPQTCGKVERFQQTLKQWLNAQPGGAHTLDELQTQLDWFRLHYNHHRPHRAAGRATPAATPPSTAIALPSRTRLNTTTVDHRGIIRIETAKVHLGVTHAGQTVTTIRTGNHIAIVHNDTLLRGLHLQPGRAYYPSGKPRGGPRQPRPH